MEGNGKIGSVQALQLSYLKSHKKYLSPFNSGYDGVNFGVGGQNFAGSHQPVTAGGYSGYSFNMPYGSYPYGYRGGPPTSYTNFRLYNTPVNTFPLGGIGKINFFIVLIFFLVL